MGKTVTKTGEMKYLEWMINTLTHTHKEFMVRLLRTHQAPSTINDKQAKKYTKLLSKEKNQNTNVIAIFLDSRRF